MEVLKDFEKKGFVEQIDILNEIANKLNMDALEALIDLYNNPIGDKPVDAMIEHTLQALLSANEKETVKLISEGTDKDKRFALKVAGLQNFTSSVKAVIELVEGGSDSELVMSAFLTMAELNDPAFLELYRKYIGDSNSLLAAICIERLGVAKDTASLPSLKEIVNKAESSKSYQKCSLEAGKAIEAISSIGTDEAIDFLVEKIHHKNPTARCFITDELVKFGEQALPALGKVFQSKDIDRKIITSNVIGWIGSRKGVKILVSALDRGAAEHPNIRFAIYEALGEISSSKGTLLLLDALKEEDDESCLTAVLTSLERQYNPLMVDKLTEILTSEPTRMALIIKIIIMVKAENIFTGLYEVPLIAKKMIAAILGSNDPDAVEVFKRKLKEMKGERAASDFQQLAQFKVSERQFRVLAVDDSSSMRSFYSSLGPEFDMDVVTAENGKIAWEILKTDGTFNLVITDMNMPVMDGIKFTRKVREASSCKTIPIIMATTESEKSQVRLAKNSGVNDFITKPIQPKVLEKKIDKLMKK